MTADSSNPSETVRGIGHAVLQRVELHLNRLVGESTTASDLLDELKGSSFAVLVQGLGLAFVLHAAPGKLAIGTDPAGATATLRAAPLDLVRLLGAASVADLKGTHAELTGDLQVAERFSQLLKLARPDIEDELSRWVGDVPAHAVGQAARGAGAWLRRAAAALRMNTAEYLQEERRVLPASLEAQAFYGDVEKLRDDVERAAARLKRLEQR
jgi:ubiquinone biosynthesis protein UbiJ